MKKVKVRISTFPQSILLLPSFFLSLPFLRSFRSLPIQFLPDPCSLLSPGRHNFSTSIKNIGFRGSISRRLSFFRQRFRSLRLQSAPYLNNRRETQRQRRRWGCSANIIRGGWAPEAFQQHGDSWIPEHEAAAFRSRGCACRGSLARGAKALPYSTRALHA